MTQLIDYPDKWIIKMFKMNERESGSNRATYHPDGISIGELPLEMDELVFGEFKDSNISYYFTQYSFIIKSKTIVKIRIKDIIKTNGSFRSGHKTIDVETSGGEKHKIKISGFPYRLQQLFYQLIEKHGSLTQEPIFQGPKNIRNLAISPGKEQLSNFNIPSDTSTVIKLINMDQNHYSIYYHGNEIGDFIYPTDDGTLIIQIENGSNSLQIFNSMTDGYNGYINDTPIPIGSISFQKLNKKISNLILVYRYSIDESEFDELKEELGLKSNDELNNLFANIQILIDSDGKILPLSEYETQ